MARLMRPFASLLAVVTTVTTPAVLAACLALCMPGMRGHAMTAPAASRTPEVDASCHEAQPVAPAGEAAFRLVASDAACCVEGLATAAPSVATERAAARLDLAGQVTPLVTWAPGLTSRVSVGLTHDRGAPPLPPRRSSILRI